jgi:hypothetical protein
MSYKLRADSKNGISPNFSYTQNSFIGQQKINSLDSHVKHQKLQNHDTRS